MRQTRVFFHNHCFDGAASAAVFTALYRHARGEAEFSYQGLTHKATGLFADAVFSGDDNAIVDFKYSADPRVTWWFDHHQSAFLSPADAQHFQRDHSGQKFYDPGYGSCTQFIADVGRTKFGLDPQPLADLIRWADTIDRARFASAEAAVKIEAPALKLALAIEGSTNPELLRRLIPDFLRAPLPELLERDYVRSDLDPLLHRHWKSLEIIRARLECKQGVIAFDLSDLDMEGYNKFIPYYFCPEGVYSVGVSRSQYRMKVSVGSNPWHAGEGLVNLAELCERYGGGGHARVGAISFPPHEPERARAAAREVVETLRATRKTP
ncbi:MAG: phosphoesterase [Terriglobales bacterium]